MSRFRRLPISRRSPIALMIVCLALTASGFKVKAARGGLGCLQISHYNEHGQFDLTQGTYTDLTSNRRPNSVRSPDGKHVSYIDDESQQIVIVSSAGSTEQSFKLPPSSSRDLWPVWSPNSHFVAHFVTLEEASTELIIVSVDGKVQQHFAIEDLGVSAPPIVLWSPDNRYIAAAVDTYFFEKSAFSESAINLYGVDGSVQQHVVEHAVGFLNCGEVCDQFDSFAWSGDSGSLLYVQFPGPERRLDIANTQFNVMAYGVDEKQNVILAKNVSDFPVYRLDHKFALIQWHGADVTNAGVLDVQKANILTLDSRNSPVDLKWLGNTALVRWDTSLVWAQADGAGKHYLDVSPARLMNGPTTVAFDVMAAYDWSRDDRWLVIMTARDDPDSDK